MIIRYAGRDCLRSQGYDRAGARRYPVLDLFEIALALAIALIVLGPERLPEVLRTVGKVMRELRAASNTVMRELTEGFDDSTPPVSRPANPPGDANGAARSESAPSTSGPHLMTPKEKS